MSLKSIDQHDLHRRRSMGAWPVRSEVAALLAALAAEGVAAPAQASRAMELLAGAEALHAPPDITAWISGADLDDLSPARIMDHLRADLADLGLNVGSSGPNLFMQVHDALVARAAAAIADDLDRILSDLRPTWDVAAEVVHDAARNRHHLHHDRGAGHRDG